MPLPLARIRLLLLPAGVCVLAAQTSTPTPAPASPTAPAAVRQAPGTAAPATPAGGPRVVTPTARRSVPNVVAPTRGRSLLADATPPRTRSVYKPGMILRRNAAHKDPKLTPQRPIPGAYPWHFDITATVFWIGERPTSRNPVPNDRSSWDTAWMSNFGGFDNPDPAYRTADFCPASFRPRLNPFYVALPYNDCIGSRQHKPEAPRVIPWFRREFEAPGSSVCKGKWIQIYYKGNYCFAQWEDCGPFTTDDWPYVFGNKPPANRANKAAGIDISPAVRDYLGIERGSATVHWRFVEFHRVPGGPWSKYGDNNPFVNPEARPKSAVSRSKPRAARRGYTRDDLHGP